MRKFRKRAFALAGSQSSVVLPRPKLDRIGRSRMEYDLLDMVFQGGGGRCFGRARYELERDVREGLLC